MGARKIQDEQELIRWFEDGWTYDQMVEEYRRKYGIETVPSMFGNFRRRRGLQRRIVRDDNLIPWHIQEEHRWAYPVAMLRAEARRRAGRKLTASDAERLAAWKERLAAQDAVLHYDPDTEEGWFYVARRPGVDNDLIREPSRKTTQRPAVS